MTLRLENDAIVVAREQKPRGLYMKNGLLVYETGRVFPADHVNWVEQDREDRADELLNR